MRGASLVVLCLLAAGCGETIRYAPVSGRVTLGGRPLANARVMFQPIPPAGSAVAAAPGSSGKTNANGEYTLTCSTGQPGAWVGKHRVMIELLAAQVEEGDTRPPRGGWPKKNQVPARYNTETTLSFEVPAEGTTRADYALETK